MNSALSYGTEIYYRSALHRSSSSRSSLQPAACLLLRPEHTQRLAGRRPFGAGKDTWIHLSVPPPRPPDTRHKAPPYEGLLPRSSAGYRPSRPGRHAGPMSAGAPLPSCTEIEPQCARAGWLFKQSKHVKKWNKRYFILWPKEPKPNKGRLLFYYNTPQVSARPSTQP
jgi:hypothetical protein